MSRPPWAPDWTAEQREEYKRDYAADRPYEQAILEHEAGECDHCDLLRKLQCEVLDE